MSSFSVRGKLSDKSFKKTGESKHGPWKIIKFLIEKTRKGEKVKIPIIAKGKWADFIDNAPVGMKLRVEFFIEGKEFNNYWNAELIATNIEEYIPKNKMVISEITQNNVIPLQANEGFLNDNNLFNQP